MFAARGAASFLIVVLGVAIVVIVALIGFCVVVDDVGTVLVIVVMFACGNVGFVLVIFDVCDNAVFIPAGFAVCGNVVFAIDVSVVFDVVANFVAKVLVAVAVHVVACPKLTPVHLAPQD